MKFKSLLYAGVLLGSAGVARADVKLSALFGDEMVLPRDREVPVWGTADAGETVEVESRGGKANAVASADGKWMLKLPARAATATPFEVTVKGKNTIVLKNVVQGDIWLASGQSNMEWRVNSARNAKEEIAAATWPQIRLFYVQRNMARAPLSNVASAWKACSPATVAGFSAVAYFFGRDIHKELDVPIGLVTASAGGTMAEPWMSAASFEGDAGLKKIPAQWDANDATYATQKANYDAALATWQTAADAAKIAAAPEPANKPAPPRGINETQRPSVLFNAMIAPLAPFAFKGVIWYQGESNAYNPVLYKTLFPTLINDWRAQFANADLPFLWVQLAGYQNAVEDANIAGQWPALRQAQDETLALPHTGQALAIDIGEADIHPKNKQDVGHRLALVALETVYKKRLVSSGPRFEKMKVEGNSIRISLINSTGLKTSDGAAPSGFAISADGKTWAWANAKIDGRDIVLSSPTIAAPIAARYAWTMMPKVNLINAANLPAAPFQKLR